MTHASWLDSDGVKIYTISAHNETVQQTRFAQRLQEVKRQKAKVWCHVPAFAIFHQGESFPYLILAWWGNDNELFTSVSVLQDEVWLEDANQYSFCVYDLEVIWAERNIFIETMDCANPNLSHYRALRAEKALLDDIP